MEAEDGAQQARFLVTDGKEGPGNDDPAAGDAEHGVAHEEEIHQGRLFELQRFSAEARNELVHLKVGQVVSIHKVLAPNGLEEIPPHLLSLMTDLDQQISDVHDLCSSTLQQRSEVAVLGLQVHAIETLVHLHGIQRPWHHCIHFQAWFVHNDELETTVFTFTAVEAAFAVLHLSPSFEELRHHAAHGAAADALQGGDRGAHHLIHTGLQHPTLRVIQRPPTCFGNGQHRALGAPQLQAVAGEILQLLHSDVHHHLVATSQGIVDCLELLRVRNRGWADHRKVAVH
mmetsp:Transcript_32432/g.52315  ORF Transcript_32432/g.52315 Transcript_32432/m.52315 type:complete len:286 (-) Transcript_32432:578-1435(-)